MSVRMLSRPPSTNSSNTSIQVALPPAPSSNSISSSPPLFPPSLSSGSPPSPFSFPLQPDVTFQTQRSLSSPPPSPAAALNFCPSVQPSSSSSISVASAGSTSISVTTSNLSSLGTNGVVVVGVIGRVEHEVSQVLDRLLDSQVFGVKGGGREQLHEPDEQGCPHYAIGKNREKETWKEGTHINFQGAVPRTRDNVARDDGLPDSDSKSKENSGSAAGLVDEKLEPKTRTLRSGKIPGGNGEVGRQKERRVEDKGAKSQFANGNSEKKRESPSEERDEGDEEGFKDACKSSPWLLSKLKHYHDEDKGIVYVQFTLGALPLDCIREDSLAVGSASDSLSATLEQHDADGLRGLLFMFSVCHVILLMQEGTHFDPRFLRTLRLLQTAKHSLAPFVKAQVLPGLLPPPPALSRPSLKPISLATSNASSGRTGVVGRNTSTIALMSGSTPVLFPGQCTPVVLFVCLEDLTEHAVGGLLAPHATRPEDTLEGFNSTVSQAGPLSQSTNYPSRQILHMKPGNSSSTMVRTNTKPEAGLRKKLQSSVEAQIRFLLKKCRIVAGSGESGPLGVGGGPGMGPRGPSVSSNSFQGVGGGGALFVLDPTRAVVLLDRSANRPTDSLDAAVDAIEAMLSGKEGSDDALWDLGSNAMMAGEDIQAVKDFLWRQADILRGKGGISSNAGGGSAGVGMVAAAAAAAAASAASGGSSGSNKPICNPPELPTISTWLSACRVLAVALSTRVNEEAAVNTINKNLDGARGLLKKGTVSMARSAASTGNVVRSKGTIDSTIACLESGADMNQKFSAAWCRRVLPSAHEVYMKGLPPCYPTSLHESHLEKSLSVFRAMVRGPAVPLYAEKLKNECEAVWQSGRQLCDAESLTGKPCIHQVHEVTDPVCSVATKKQLESESPEMSKVAREKRRSKPHSSGVVFLHACACGRSRKLRKDPFDFVSANVSFFKFSSCEDLLPSLVIPTPKGGISSEGSPWSLICLGNSRYYQPSSGLLQSGFCPNQNYLSSWNIPIIYRKAEVHEEIIPLSPPKEQVVELLPFSTGKTAVDSKIVMKSLLPRVQPVFESKSAGVSLYSKVAEKGYLDSSRSTSIRGNPGGSDSRRGFLDVATKANYGGESAFPPLPQKQEKAPQVKSGKQSGGKEKKESLHVLQEHHEANSKSLMNEVADKINERAEVLQGLEEEHESNVKGLGDMGTTSRLNSASDHAQVYIGFEHECPHGHRFLLSSDHLERPGSSNLVPTAGVGKQDSGNGVRSSKYKKPDRSDLYNRDSQSMTKARELHSGSLQGSNGKSAGLVSLASKGTGKETKIPDDMQYWSVQDGQGDGLSLLNSNLPIYMNCPYCKTSEEDKKGNSKGVVFGGTISQLQRIFLVTPPLPLLLATHPVVEFEDISKPVKTVMEFNPGSEVVLPPDRFLSLRLPFVYYSQVDGVPTKPLLVKSHKPEQTAWLVKGTALYVMSKGGVNGPLGG